MLSGQALKSNIFLGGDGLIYQEKFIIPKTISDCRKKTIKIAKVNGNENK